MAVFNRSDARRKRITGLIVSFTWAKLTTVIFVFDRVFQRLSNDALIFNLPVSGDL